MDSNRGKSCSFFGHRVMDIPQGFDDKTAAFIKEKITDGFTVFYFTWDNKFDVLCFDITLRLKDEYPNIKLVRCFPDEKELARNKRYSLKHGFDDCVCFALDFNYWYTRLYYRNCALIDASDFCFFYVERTDDSGAYKAMKHAKKVKKPFVNLSPNADKI